MMTHPTHRIDEVYDLLRGSVPEVFGTMLSMNAEPGEPVEFVSNTGEAMVAASVGFVGETTGIVYLHLTAPFARALAGRMLGMEEEEFDGDEMVNDVIGELSNMVVGAVKSRLCDEGLTCALTIPSFVRGTGVSVGATGGPDRRLLGFRCGDGGVVVELLMQPPL